MNGFRLDDRRVLVTGAGSGLGRQFALTLAGAGATVVLAGRRLDRLEEVAREVHAAGGRASCVTLDVTDNGSVTQCFAEIHDSVGALDVLVNNAGISRSGLLVELEQQDWDAVVDTNLKGVFLVAREAARAMIQAGSGGAIVNIASILGLRVSKALSPYIAAKHGVIGLTQSMALELAPHGIRVNAIAPGFFPTEINRGFFDTEAGREVLKRVPMRRVGRLAELDGPLLLLASDAGSFMTGSTITVDGGHLVSSL